MMVLYYWALIRRIGPPGVAVSASLLSLSLSVCVKERRKKMVVRTAVRMMTAKKPKPKMKPIELNTQPEQTQTITRAIFDIVRDHGPLTIAQTWERIQVSLAVSLLLLQFWLLNTDTIDILEKITFSDYIQLSILLFRSLKARSSWYA